MEFFSVHHVPAATHNCWAYQIAAEYRFHDDGEPGGTAGRPILQAIQSQNCDRVAVLVVRWYGGVKLGAGGLARAYGGTAAQCLRLADRVELIDEITLDCGCSYTDVALVRSRFSVFQVRVQTESFNGHGVQWRLALPRAQQSSFVEEIMNLTRGQARCDAAGIADDGQS